MDPKKLRNSITTIIAPTLFISLMLLSGCQQNTDQQAANPVLPQNTTTDQNAAMQNTPTAAQDMSAQNTVAETQSTGQNVAIQSPPAPAQTQSTPSKGQVTLNTGSYNVSLTAPSGWVADQTALTVKKGNDSMLFNPDYTPGVPQTPPQQKIITITTNNNQTLNATVMTYPNDPNNTGALVDIQDPTSDFSFTFISSNTTISDEAMAIIKTLSWQKSA